VSFLNQSTESKIGGKKKKFWNKYIIPITSLIILILIVSIITYYRVLIQIDIGPLSDTCDFLLNALYFSGQGVGYYDWSRPPFFSFLVSIFFRLGFISTSTMYIIDGMMFIAGVIGFYLLLNLHFNKIESFFGGLLYSTFPGILLLVGLGFSDFTSITILIWTFYFLILAVNKNSKYFILFCPMFMMAFLTRYNIALAIFPIVFYLLINRKEIKSIKNILIGICVSFLLIIPVFIFFYQKFGNILYPFLSNLGYSSSSSFLPEYYPYDPNLLYFVEKFPIHTGFEGLLILFIVFIGGLMFFILKFKNNTFNVKKAFVNYKSNIEHFNFKLISFAILSIILIGTFGQVHYIFAEAIFFVLSLLFYSLVKNLSLEDIDMHLLILSWFMVFFIFNSIYVIKSDRYFILMAPPIAYLLLLGLSSFANKISFKFKNKNISFSIIALIFTALILFSTSIYLPDIKNDNQDYKYSNEQVAIASEWFTNYDPNYKNKIIYSDLWPYLSWSLKTDIKMMPLFKNNKKYEGGVKNSTFTPQDSMMFNNFLVNNNADYYFCVQEINLTAYKPIKKFGTLIIYERKF
jgi:4-amino-4-deoxy-L-arabinose transferase-like glycosyltransferase